MPHTDITEGFLHCQLLLSSLLWWLSLSTTISLVSMRLDVKHTPHARAHTHINTEHRYRHIHAWCTRHTRAPLQKTLGKFTIYSTPSHSSIHLHIGMPRTHTYIPTDILSAFLFFTLYSLHKKTHTHTRTPL